VSCIDKNNPPWIKNAQMLWFALVKIYFAIQQNIEYFVQKWHEFLNSVQIALK
jgi:hypothetical protein